MAIQWNPMEKACTSKNTNNNRKKQTKYNRDLVAFLREGRVIELYCWGNIDTTPLTPHISVKNTHELETLTHSFMRYRCKNTLSKTGGCCFHRLYHRAVADPFTSPCLSADRSLRDTHPTSSSILQILRWGPFRHISEQRHHQTAHWDMEMQTVLALVVVFTGTTHGK